MLDTTSDLFDGLAGIAGAKTVVLVSGGFGMGSEVESTVRKVVSRGVRAGARVYAIDPLGLQRVGGPPDVLNTLSVDTGGLVIFHENNFGRALDAIAADTGVYYLLGVRPLNRKFDGKYREIDVRVNAPGVSVRARRGYLAVDPTTLRSPSGR
jgi:VWFA-related protein